MTQYFKVSDLLCPFIILLPIRGLANIILLWDGACSINIGMAR